MAKTIKEKETAIDAEAGALAAQGGELTEAQKAELELYDPGEDAGAGMEDITMDERRIPFLRILDPKSPQCRPAAQGGVPGARGGSLFNTSTQQVYDGEIGGEFIPSHRDQKFVEYIKRNEDGSGGGFVGIMEPDAPTVLELRARHGKFGKLPMGIDPQGKAHELVQTFYLYGTFYPPNDDPFRCMVGFASTQIKKYTGFVERTDAWRYDAMRDGKIVRIKPPIWAHRWHLSTQYESKGTNSWYGYVLTLAEKNPDGTESRQKSRMPTSDPRYIAAREFYELVKAGTLKADYQAGASNIDPADEGDGGGQHDSRRPVDPNQHEIPF